MIAKLLSKIGLFEIAHGTTLLSGVVLMLWTSRFQGADALGMLGIWLTWSLILSQIGVLGFHNTIISFGSAGKEVSLSSIQLAHKWGAGLSLVICGVIGLVMLLVYHAGLLNISAAFLGLLLVNIVIISQTKMLVARATTLGLKKPIALANLMRAIALALGVVSVFEVRADLFIAIWIWLFAEMVQLVGLLVILRKPTADDRTRQTLAEVNFSFKSYLRRAFASSLTNLANDVNTKVDMIMVSLFLPLEMVGIYTLIMTVSEGFMGFATLKRGEFFTVILGHLKKGGVAELKAFLADQYRWFALLGVPSFVGGVLYMALTLGYLSSEMVISLILTLTGVFLVSPAILMQNLFFTLNKIGVFTGFMLVSVLCNAVLNLTLIPMIGIIGAAVGTCISFGLLAFLIQRSILKQTALSLA